MLPCSFGNVENGKVTITSIIDFNNEVINKLAGYKEIRVDLIF